MAQIDQATFPHPSYLTLSIPLAPALKRANNKGNFESPSWAMGKLNERNRPTATAPTKRSGRGCGRCLLRADILKDGVAAHDGLPNSGILQLATVYVTDAPNPREKSSSV